LVYLYRPILTRCPSLVERTRDVSGVDDLEKRPIWSMWSDGLLTTLPGLPYASPVRSMSAVSLLRLSVDDFHVSNNISRMTDPWVDGPPDAHIPKQPERRIPGPYLRGCVHADRLCGSAPWSRKSGRPIESRCRRTCLAGHCATASDYVPRAEGPERPRCAPHQSVVAARLSSLRIRTSRTTNSMNW